MKREIVSWILSKMLSEKQFVLFFLGESVIRARKRRNAISLVGLFATWVLEMTYIIVGAILAVFTSDSNILRETINIMISFGYYLIPLIQIQTTPSIKSFMQK